MSKSGQSFNAARRKVLSLFGLGAAGTALGVVVASDKVFAKQFCGAAANVKAAPMLYDPDLQVMVDPLTRKPIFEDAKKLRLANPTVTAGCKDCPKKDD